MEKLPKQFEAECQNVCVYVCMCQVCGECRGGTYSGIRILRTGELE